MGGIMFIGCCIFHVPQRNHEWMDVIMVGFLPIIS